MEHYPDFPLPSIEDAINPKDIEYDQWDSESTFSGGEPHGAFPLGENTQTESSSYDTDLSYETFDSFDSDEYSLPSTHVSGGKKVKNEVDRSKCGQEKPDRIVVLDKREVTGVEGWQSQYLIKCWIDEKHMAIFTELMNL